MVMVKYAVCVVTKNGQIWVKKCREYTEVLDSLEPRVIANGASSHMFNLSWDIFTETGLVLGQHF